MVIMHLSHVIRGEDMARKPGKVKSASSGEDVLDLGAAQHRVASVRDYGRAETIWRNIRFPALWMVGAFLSLLLIIFVGSTEGGSERLALLPDAIGSLVGQARGGAQTQVAQAVSHEVQAVRDETRRLAQERARLEQRVAVIERELNDVTGSVRRQNDVTGSVPVIDRREPPAEQVANIDPPVSPPAPRPEPPSTALKVQKIEEPPAPGAITIATRTQFGLDLGSENTLTGLRSRWLRLAERNKPILSKLDPLVAVRDGPNGFPVLYLIAGPVADAAEAATLCAQLRTAKVNCQPSPYDGQRLTLR